MQRGFALPLTIFLITLVTILLGVSFSRSSIEFEIADGGRATVDVFAVARSGLESFFGDTIYDRPAPGDSLRYNVVGGYTWIVPTITRQTADTLDGLTYLVRSTGYLIDPAQGSTPLATRSIGQFARWRFAALPMASHIAFNGIDYNAGSPDFPLLIHGDDQCVPGGGTVGYRGIGGDAPSGGAAVGAPTGYVITGSVSTLDAALGVDWQTVRSGNLATDYTSADYAGVINGNTTFASYLLSEPQVYLTNISGTGLLIVENELDLEGNSFYWRGVVLVGGRLDADVVPGGPNSMVVEGVVITGLNRTLPTPPAVGPNTFDDGSRAPLTMRYNSCNVHEALKRYKGFRPIENTVVDNWATY